MPSEGQTVISGEDITHSIADALQYISYYHPSDFIRHLAVAYHREENPPAKNALALVLANSRMAAFGRRPICQDTGLVVVFVKVGMRVRIDAERSLEDLVNEGVRRAYLDPVNPLRASIVKHPLSSRENTRDNTPAIVHVEIVPGAEVTFSISAKGGGSENKARFAQLDPSASIADWVVETVASLGGGWCPPGVISVGVGGSSEKAMLMAKEALNGPLDFSELLARGAATPEEALRLELYEKINALGIGAQGLGGLTTVVDVKVSSYPTHAASKPVALIPQCAANRHVTFKLDGSGPARLTPPDLREWPETGSGPMIGTSARGVHLDTLTKDETTTWRVGETLLLSGKMLTGRDAVHRRLVDLIDAGKGLPVDMSGRVIYYVGPVPAAANEIIGPAGPTTASRMDRFVDKVLQATALYAMIGKAERGPSAIAAIKKYKVPYLIAVGGAAYLISKSIRSAKVVAFEDLGMEAIHEIEVTDMPVTVAVDAEGHSIHDDGPARWRQHILQRTV